MREDEEVIEKPKKRKGRPITRVTVNNFHEVVSEVSSKLVAKKDFFKVDYRTEKHMDDLINSYREKGYGEIDSKTGMPLKAPNSEDVQKLDSAIEAMGDDFWKRYRANKRQKTFKRNNAKKQIPISADVHSFLLEEKNKYGRTTWDDHLFVLQHHDRILDSIFESSGIRDIEALVKALEQKGLIKSDVFKKHWGFLYENN